MTKRRSEGPPPPPQAEEPMESEEIIHDEFAENPFDDFDAQLTTPETEAAMAEIAARSAPQNRAEALAAALEEQVAHQREQARLAAELEELRRSLRERRMEREILAFKDARGKYLTLVAVERNDSPKVVKAEHDYIKTRNELLYRAIRFHQSRMPLQEDGSRGEEYARQRQRLFNYFVTNERVALLPIANRDVDLVYSLSFDPLLLEEFGPQMYDTYKGDTEREHIFPHTALMERILSPEYLKEDFEYLEATLTESEKKELHSARTAYLSSVIGAYSGFPHPDAVSIEKNYRRLKAQALEAIPKIKPKRSEERKRKIGVPYSEDPQPQDWSWVDELEEKARAADGAVKDADVALEAAFKTLRLSQEKQARIRTLAGMLGKMKWGRNAAALIALLGAVTSDAPKVDVTPMHDGARIYNVQKPPLPQPLEERTQEAPRSITIEIPQGGSVIKALRQLEIDSYGNPRYGTPDWVTGWILMAKTKYPHLTVSSEGIYEALAISAGFMTPYNYDKETDSFISDSARIPADSRIEFTDDGMYFIFPDGNKQEIIRVQDSEIVPLGYRGIAP